MFIKLRALLFLAALFGLTTTVQAGDENYRDIAHGLGLIGKILEEKNAADREGREVRLDTQFDTRA